MSDYSDDGNCSVVAANIIHYWQLRSVGGV